VRHAARHREAARVTTFAVTTAGGLEQVALAEIRERFGQVRAQVFAGARHGRVVFQTERSPRLLLGLRAADNAFAVLAQITGITTGAPGLARAVAAVRDVDLAPALHLFDTLNGQPQGRTCRLIATVSGGHRFSAGQLQALVRSELAAAHGLGSAGGPDGYVFHLQVAGSRAWWALQLSSARLRRRPYRLAGAPGGLDPPVAYCMGRLAQVPTGGVCVDPMCGAATTLIELALTQPARSLGGDVSATALQAARADCAAAGVPVRLARWDAACLPLRTASVDAVLCNMPYGKRTRFGAASDPALVLGELGRVLRSGGTAVVLSTDTDLIEARLGLPQAPLVLRQRLRLHLRGVDPVLYVMARV
jgi:23S rRNA G2445 N2-methylase RlmL